MKIVVDTNVVFSAILNTDSQIADLLLTSSGTFEFYPCHLLREEIDNHRDKLLALSNYGEVEFAEVDHQVLLPLQFISEEIIPFEFWQRALFFVRDVDMDDIAFVALTEFMNCKLWTGDRKLLKGIRAKGYMNAVSTEELFQWRAELESKSASSD